MIIGDAYRIIFVTACQGVHVDETKINAMQNIIKGDAMWDKRIVRCMDDFMQRFIEKTSKLQFAFVEGNKKIYPSDIVYIERGYERFEEKLRSLGAEIEKVTTEREIQKFRMRVG